MQILPMRISSWKGAKQIERGKNNHHTPIYFDLSDFNIERSFAAGRGALKNRETLIIFAGIANDFTKQFPNYQ